MSVVESRINVFQDVKGMLEQKVDIKVLAVVGLGQGTDAMIVKRIFASSFTSTSFPPTFVGPHFPLLLFLHPPRFLLRGPFHSFSFLTS